MYEQIVGNWRYTTVILLSFENISLTTQRHSVKIAKKYNLAFFDFLHREVAYLKKIMSTYFTVFIGSILSVVIILLYPIKEEHASKV